tara:strand:- start:99 stop:833 length:735 start_codon:yes stop_codon:yes gene_type:complete
MKPSILIACCLLLLALSCKTINLIQTPQTNTTQQVSLGSIGSGKEFVLQKGFDNSAVPNYKAPIKLSVITRPFTKQTYKAFIKAKALQSADIAVTYIDSVPNKPKYLQLQIADKVAIITALNSEENRDVKDYLSLNTYAQVLSSMSVVFNQKDIESINNADAVFLIQNGIKTYAIQLYKNKVKTQTISFNDGVVFEYQTSYCCWQENNKHQIDIVDLVSTFSACPNNTYRSPKRSKKNINYYKL